METNRYSATLELEKKLGEQIYNALQGKIVEDVIRKVKISNSDSYMRSNMEGHSLKVEKELLKDIYELCYEVKNKLNINPGMRDGMIRYMIHIILADKKITNNEIDLIYNFGEKLGMSEIEIANAIAEAIQQSYVPSLDAIC